MHSATDSDRLAQSKRCRRARWVSGRWNSIVDNRHNCCGGLGSRDSASCCHRRTVGRRFSRPEGTKAKRRDTLVGCVSLWACASTEKAPKSAALQRLVGVSPKVRPPAAGQPPIKEEGRTSNDFSGFRQNQSERPFQSRAFESVVPVYV